jgi:hypothetical protein
MHDGKICSLVQPECLCLTWFLAVVMMRSVLEHCIFKALPDCYHEHQDLSDHIVATHAYMLAYPYTNTPCVSMPIKETGKIMGTISQVY